LRPARCVSFHDSRFGGTMAKMLKRLLAAWFGTAEIMPEVDIDPPS
jgi:hypothetical protein